VTPVSRLVAEFAEFAPAEPALLHPNWNTAPLISAVQAHAVLVTLVLLVILNLFGGDLDRAIEDPLGNLALARNPAQA
jgi:hypothetical protein